MHQYKEQLLEKINLKGSLSNKYLKDNNEVYSISLCLGQQKKMKVALRILEINVEDLFSRDVMEYFLISTNYFKKRLQAFEDRNEYSQQFLDYITLRGGYVNFLMKYPT